MKSMIAALCFTAILFPKTVPLDPCLQEVDAIFKTMYGHLPKEDRVAFVSYEVITTNRPQGPKEQEESRHSTVRTYAGQQQYRFISDDIEVYQDKDDLFTVIPMRKVIYRANAGIKTNGDERLRQMKQLQDTLFRNSDRVICTKLTGSGADKLVTLFPAKKWVELTQIASVDYYLNSEKKELQRQVIHYTNLKKLKSVEYIFREIDYDHRLVSLRQPVKSLFMDGNKLRPAYAGYQLIDVRDQKHKKEVSAKKK